MVEDRSEDQAVYGAIEEMKKELKDKIHVIYSDKNYGSGASRNTGILHAYEAGFPFILFNDSDDISDPRRLELVRFNSLIFFRGRVPASFLCPPSLVYGAVTIYRIANRVRKGGHDIPPDDVIRRLTHRFESLDRIVPLCDKVVFYDNDNGFVKVAEITDGTFRFTKMISVESGKMIAIM